MSVEPPAALAQISMGEGDTPLTTLVVGGREFTAKLEFESPTGSFKDRGAAVLVAAAVDIGAAHLVADSSGNAGVAIAAYAARAGLSCEVFVAASTSQDKIDRIDATVRLVDGSREDVAAAAIERVETTGAFYASHVWNPWFLEGTKHYVREIYHQLGGRLPGALVLPAGNGTLVLGAWRAMQELGVVVPIIGVQAAKCAPIAAAFFAEADDVTAVVDGGTVAAGIAIAAPVRGREILEAVRGSGGSLVTVTDEELLECAAELADQGMDVEPTAAAPLAAALRRDDGEVIVPVASARRATQERGRSRTR
jgi:threonine synthase